MLPIDWVQIQTHILELEQKSLVTRTFRRLDLDRQKAVIDAILAESIEKGPTELNIKKVAERAGVSVGSLYQYFCNRQGLLDFAMDLVVRYTVDLFNSVRPYFQDMPLTEALSAYLLSGIEWSQTESGFIQFLARAAYQGDPELQERVVRPIATVMREITRDLLVQAQRRGEIREDIDLEASARLVHALIIAMGDTQLLPYLNVYFQVTDASLNLQRLLDALFPLLLKGLGAGQAQ